MEEEKVFKCQNCEMVVKESNLYKFGIGVCFGKEGNERIKHNWKQIKND